jgi:hypothetical protein
MKFRIALAVILAAVPLASASAMTVSTFLAKAEALKKKGPLALFSGDLKLLKSEISADAAQLRAERLAAEAAGRRGAFCPPAGGVKLTDEHVLEAMTTVPPAHRARTDTKDALRAYLAKRHPCPAA